MYIIQPVKPAGSRPAAAGQSLKPPFLTLDRRQHLVGAPRDRKPPIRPVIVTQETRVAKLRDPGLRDPCWLKEADLRASSLRVPNFQPSGLQTRRSVVTEKDGMSEGTERDHVLNCEGGNLVLPKVKGTDGSHDTIALFGKRLKHRERQFVIVVRTAGIALKHPNDGAVLPGDGGEGMIGGGLARHRVATEV